MTEARKFHFDDILLKHIEFGRNTEAKSMLTEELAMEVDEFGTLLHRAAYHGNTEVLKHLIKLGSDVDFARDADRKTALMIAVQKERLGCVKALLGIGANIDIADAQGQSAPQMVFHSDYFDSQIIEVFVRTFRDKIDKSDILIHKLLKYGCTMHHVIILRDLYLIRFMLESDFEGFNVEEKLVAVTDTVVKEQPTIIRIILGLDSDQNIEYRRSACNNLSITLYHRIDESGKVPEWKHDSLSLRLGSYFENDSLFRSASNSFNYLVANQVMLEKCGTPILETAECYKSVWEFGHWTEYEKYHDLCRQILDTTMFGTLTLFHLLTDKLNKMKRYVGNKTFATEIEEACCKHHLSDVFPYYYKTLMIRIARADQIHNLEDTAIAVLSKIFNSNYNECYDFARKVIGYLTKEDLERLSVLWDQNILT